MWGVRSVLSDSSGFLPSDGHKVAFLCVKKVQIRVEMLQVSCAAPRGSPRLQITPQLVKWKKQQKTIKSHFDLMIQAFRTTTTGDGGLSWCWKSHVWSRLCVCDWKSPFFFLSLKSESWRHAKNLKVTRLCQELGHVEKKREAEPRSYQKDFTFRLQTSRRDGKILFFKLVSFFCFCWEVKSLPGVASLFLSTPKKKP